MTLIGNLGSKRETLLRVSMSVIVGLPILLIYCSVVTMDSSCADSQIATAY